jgi:hypothetical protein
VPHFDFFITGTTSSSKWLAIKNLNQGIRCPFQFFATDAEAAAIPLSLEIILALLPRCCFAPLPPNKFGFFYSRA